MLSGLALTPLPYALCIARRHVSNYDKVPSMPPFDNYFQVPHSIWLIDEMALLQVWGVGSGMGCRLGGWGWPR